VRFLFWDADDNAWEILSTRRIRGSSSRAISREECDKEFLRAQLARKTMTGDR
jgi:hypothetical protein